MHRPPSRHPASFAYSILLSGILLGVSSAAMAQSLPRADGGTTPIKSYGVSPGCIPTMIISHGFGGSEAGNAALAESMARNGWRAIVMGHQESGRPALRQALLSGSPRQSIIEATTTPQKHRMRFLDLDAAFKEATRLCRPSRLVLAGHSMGAMTTMLEAGASAKFGRFGSNRFDAYIAISPQGVGYSYAQGAWSGVSRPVLMITGTSDNGSDGGPETRLSAFEGLPPGRKRLAIIPGAGHLSLAANHDNSVSATVAKLSLEFVNSYASGRNLPVSNIQNVDIRDK
jgi:pimeloyl-ACP methyl ester carboxylesterase